MYVLYVRAVLCTMVEGGKNHRQGSVQMRETKERGRRGISPTQEQGFAIINVEKKSAEIIAVLMVRSSS